MMIMLALNWIVLGEEAGDIVITEVIDDVFMMALCDFINRLTNFQFIPQTSVQIISEEYLKNYLKSNEDKASTLRKSVISQAFDQKLLKRC